MLEGGLQLSRPLEPFGRAGRSIGERPEDGGGAWNETAVKVDEAEEPLKVLNGGRRREILEVLDMRGQKSLWQKWYGQGK